MVEFVHSPGKGVAGLGIHRQRPAKDGAGGQPRATGARRAPCAAQTRARARTRGRAGLILIAHARPGDAVRGLIVAVVAHRRDEQFPHRVPNHRGSRISVGQVEHIARSLHVRPRSVRDGGQRPGGPAVQRVVEALVARARPNRIHQRALVGLRDRGHHQLLVYRAPGKARKTLPGKAVDAIGGIGNQGPGCAAVSGAQNSRAVVGVEGVVGVACAGQNHICSTRLHGERANADGGFRCAAQGRQVVGKGYEADAGCTGCVRILRPPNSAAGGAHVEGVAGRIRRVQRQRGDAAGDEAKALRQNGCGAQRLPCCGSRRFRLRPGLGVGHGRLRTPG